MIYVLNNGVQEIKEKHKLYQLFCKHEYIVKGEDCSENGLIRINGSTTITVCRNCGKVLNRFSTIY